MGKWDVDRNPWHTEGDVQMFSGCEDSQCSMDVTVRGKAAGAMTTALCDVLGEHARQKIPYPEMLNKLRDVLVDRNFTQRPQMSSSQPFKPEQKDFSLAEGMMPNLNKVLGQGGRPAKGKRQNAEGFQW